MAKVQLPLLGVRASGSVGDALVFGNWKGINTVRQHVVPANPKSTAQTAQRNLLAWTVAAWRFAPAPVQDGFIESAKGMGYTGFNAFSKRNLLALKGQSSIASFTPTPGMSGAVVVESVSASVTGSTATCSVVLGLAPSGTTVSSVVYVALKEQTPVGDFIAPYYVVASTTSPYSATLNVSGGAGSYRLWAFTICDDGTSRTKYGVAASTQFTIS